VLNSVATKGYLDTAGYWSSTPTISLELQGMISYYCSTVTLVLSYKLLSQQKNNSQKEPEKQEEEA